MEYVTVEKGTWEETETEWTLDKSIAVMEWKERLISLSL